MDSIISGLQSAFATFFSFKAYVILPIFMLILALAARMKLKEAILAAIKIGAGFSGVFIVFSFFVTQISPAIEAIISLRGLNYPVADVGWPPLAAITWSSPLTPLLIPLIMLLNLAMLITRSTKTLYIDLWNYWHFALIGVLVQNVSGSLVLGIASSLLIALITIKTAEWSAPYVKREMGLDGLAISPVSVAALLPYAVALNRAFDAIPGLRRLNWDPSRSAAKAQGPQLLQEPMVIGIVVGASLSLLAGYDLKGSLETSINIAAVMFLLPKCGGLIGEGMGAVSMTFKLLVEKRFSSMRGLSIAVDTGILMTNPSVIATGLILIPVSLFIAFILPGNRVIPLGDLPNLISIMSLTTLVMGGNVLRSVLAGIPVIASFLLIASDMAPLYTSQAAAAGMSLDLGGRDITAFTDGGNQLRYWFYWLFQGNIAAMAAIPVVLALLWYAWRDNRKISAL
ncbi:MAG TPA: PTS galactitol transporter subunit IIC [Spirochaetaceae bacterium]|jgi:PTS system galactitol-specific IIC component|nr:PTS galactitol transporter subunit IIC [Spirochaetaceae bacterium]